MLQRIKSKKHKNSWVLIPTLGSLIFIVLYFVATLFYPGGSQIDHNSIGFSWVNNYWCNLLDEQAINGQKNAAQPVAISAMLVLCVTLIFFWLLFPSHINMSKLPTRVVQFSGILAMATSLLLPTSLDHDLITNSASIFGLIAVAGTFFGLCKAKWYGLFAFGCLNILLVALNNYVYYNNQFIVYLPIIQKISFVSFLVWICLINISIYRKALQG